jgi:hypothetical protein
LVKALQALIELKLTVEAKKNEDEISKKRKMRMRQISVQIELKSVAFYKNRVFSIKKLELKSQNIISIG